MGHPLRIAEPGLVYHALNRGNGRRTLFFDASSPSPSRRSNHLLTVCRYVERNALLPGLVAHAEDWPWSSLWRRTFGPASARVLLSEGPVPRPEGWTEYVNAPQNVAELEAVRRCVNRGQPFGASAWTQATADRLRLSQTLRPRGRPRQRPPEAEETEPQPRLF